MVYHHSVRLIYDTKSSRKRGKTISDDILQLNEAAIKGELKDLVKTSVEETLNALLEHEADELVNAGRYERSEERKGYRFGHYDRNFTTTAGDVMFHVPKL